MSPEVAAFLLRLLDAQQISVGGSDFEPTVRLILAAKAALAKMVED